MFLRRVQHTAVVLVRSTLFVQKRSFTTTRTVFENKKIVHTAGAGKAIGAYSPAVQYGDLLFVSGQLGLVDGKLVSEDVAEQTKVALTNMVNILKNSGSSPENVLKCTVLLDDIANFSKVNEVYLKCKHFFQFLTCISFPQGSTSSCCFCSEGTSCKWQSGDRMHCSH
jgi:2-iminobutanoate/2-iminopropanoate deaminase